MGDHSSWAVSLMARKERVRRRMRARQRTSFWRLSSLSRCRSRSSSAWEATCSPSCSLACRSTCAMYSSLVVGSSEFISILQASQRLIILFQFMKRLERLSYYEVEAIVDSKPDGQGSTLYLVKWKNWPPETNTWEPVKHLSTVKPLIRDFHNAQKAPQTNAAPAEQVKRKRGRPRIIREPATTDAKQQTNAQANVASKAERLASVVEENTHPVIESPSEPAIKLEEGQTHKENRKKPIRKLHRATTKPLIMPFLQQKQQPHSQELSKAKESDKERQANREKGKAKEKPAVSEAGEEDRESEQLGLQQVLKQCLNYTGVKVSFKDRTFYYQIPFVRDGRQLSLTVTAAQIIKVNQRWFEGFFEGFYL